MKKSKKDIHYRKKYMDHSRKFLDWMDGLGFEKTLLGKVAQYFEVRFQIRRLLLFFLYCVVLSFVLFLDIDYTQNVQIGEIANSDIKSPLNIQIIDEVATEAKRSEAEKGVLPLFDYDPEAFEKAFNKVYSAFRNMREKVRAVNWPKSEVKKEIVVKDFLKHKPQFEEELGVTIKNRDFEWLVNKKFSVQIENIIIRAISFWSQLKISGNIQNLVEDKNQQVLLRTIDPSGKGNIQAIASSDVFDLRDRKAFTLNNIRGVKAFNNEENNILQRVAHSLLVANVTFNKQETTSRRQQARDAVLPVQISIKRNQTIVSAGSKIQPIHVAILNEIKNIKSDHRKDFISLVSSLLFVVVILVFISFFKRFTKSHLRIQFKDYLVMGAVALLIAMITKLFLFMTDAAFITKFGDLVPPSFFLYAAPIAAGPMLVGLMITYGEIVWIFTAFLSIAIGMMVDYNFTVMLIGLVGGIAGARGVYGCEKRNDIYIAGLRTGLINAIIIAFMVMMDKSLSGQVINNLIWNVPAGLIGGVLSSMVAMMFIPLLEAMFNVTTDIKLLELSNLNHPLMKQMMVKAPGTYHHSLAVGTMVEEAASKIGANSLLAKVMAYYHDIGKMEHAQYFVENQRPGYNPHDHISPFMSKTILIAHVKDGAEMGLKYKLGQPIIDGILQHHGTTLISYFYNKALAEQDEDLSPVEESEFRYPGPKPQFKEAALVMLGDSIEAAARSMEEPTATRLTHLVKNIIQNKFIDGQLDECNLTLSELSVIEHTFKKTLLSIYHQRIDYPHMKLGAPVEQKNKKALHSISNK
ncbi:MAG: HDIG domain-containing protein [Bdellovibrionales bacterium]|nr:HDIG domain-containing protein [Bdellovibrionales bacterium]